MFPKRGLSINDLLNPSDQSRGNRNGSMSPLNSRSKNRRNSSQSSNSSQSNGHQNPANLQAFTQMQVNDPFGLPIEFAIPTNQRFTGKYPLWSAYQRNTSNPNPGWLPNDTTLSDFASSFQVNSNPPAPQMSYPPGGGGSSQMSYTNASQRVPYNMMAQKTVYNHNNSFPEQPSPIYNNNFPQQITYDSLQSTPFRKNCMMCRRTFTSKEAYERHLPSHQVFVCPFPNCNAKYFQLEPCKAHYAKHFR
ncbi:hypothetical protein DASC09_061030 [Saccharomycopsis crataegensis]|uniref:C2H2-type domain-containing protein n=1 Tax=Saccharomycopsis crataegensis TaxID=43959 RepID=A0AAV5QVB8_9ASCO|nr:hypothetical protein DASC09_061030 [Saccharomycopsis crataegensis]